MATLMLAAAGAALGGGLGGTVLGLSGAVLGRAVGATLGHVIDQRLLGGGSETVEVGKLDRYRIMGASEGAAIPQVYGRTRIAGQVIWATRFKEETESSGSGKGSKPSTTSYSYSVSLAIALCEGEISSVGRIWADGIEVAPADLNLRIYTGSADQLPDPKIEAVEGTGMAPAYRGTAYVVLEDLALAPYGNRIPQFSFEVLRPAQGAIADGMVNLQRGVKAVAMIPGTGEYSLATTPVHYNKGLGVNTAANVSAVAEKTDFLTSLRQLGEELPSVGSVSLVVSWFGSDLRCGDCLIAPKVEQNEVDGEKMPWSVAGLTRPAALTVPQEAGRPVYGGTPTDASVIEAIRAIRDSGREVMFYPFILMEQMAGNALPDPYGAGEQPVLPWRGRITTSVAPGGEGTPDRTAAAEAEVAAFIGTGEDWRYRRFILHYARLCAEAGGVDAFCIGSEMRGLTQIRGAGDSFPAVEALCGLAEEVRAILPDAKISYAADWSEYFGYHTGGNVYFHLDPLWAHPAIDFIGIDNYMPLSDWREGEAQADRAYGSIYNLDYLTANVAGGEGYDWYYDGPEGLAAQNRKAIADGAHDEPWVYRYKDLRGWWSNPHHERREGERLTTPTAWEPQSKPIVFTEYGCAAIDRGTNEPNKFLDPKSSESVLPRGSAGRRDDTIQMQYLRAMAGFWTDAAQNPVSEIYGGAMVDFDRAHVWAWDARPFPAFPNDTDFWSDGENYPRGHWLNGRAASQPLASVVAEICERSGMTDFDVSGLYGVVRGYAVQDVGTARAALQSLMLAYGFEALERDGRIVFRMRDGLGAVALDPERFALTDDETLQLTRLPDAETAGHVRVAFTEAEADYETRQSEAIFPDEESRAVSQTDLPLVLTASEGRRIAERWLSEARIARDTARFALPPSMASLGAGDIVEMQGARWRIDRIDQAEALAIEAVRIEPSVYIPSDATEERATPRAFTAPVPTYPVFLDLPLMKGTEVPHAPHIAVTATPWPGNVAVWSAPEDAGYTLNRLVERGAVIGVTQTPLMPAACGLWDRGEALRVQVYGGTLASATEGQVMNGANAIAIGDGFPDNWEVFQFANATLAGQGIYDLSMRLRGQLGTDALMPAEGWPAGSIVVLLDAGVGQITLDASARNLARHYRIGGAARGYDDSAVVHQVQAFAGNGLRPYAPAHLRVTAGSDGTRLTWVRRSRIDGDSWEGYEVPLGEERETYLVRVIATGTIRREATVTAPEWTYTAAMRAADGGGEVTFAVAQVSDRFGPGPFRTVAA